MSEEKQELGLIKLNGVTTEVKIDATWFETRDKLLSEVKSLAAIDSMAAYEQAAAHLVALTKSSNKVEDLRLDISRPFNAAAKAIKKVADDAKQPLDDEKLRIQRIMTLFLKEEEKRRQEAARLAEEKSRLEAEQLVHEAEERREAERAFGLGESSQAPIVMAEALVDVPAPVRAAGVRLQETFAIKILDPDAVTRNFCSPDEPKIRAWLKSNAELVKNRLKDEGQFLSGLEISIDTKPISSGRH